MDTGIASIELTEDGKVKIVFCTYPSCEEYMTLIIDKKTAWEIKDFCLENLSLKAQNKKNIITKMKSTKIHTDNPEWITWVGKKVTKVSGKPFKSQNIVGTVIGMETNPHSNNTAFLMDDNSVVDCFRCQLKN